MSTNTAGGVTVTPIYWQPSGGQDSFPAGFVAIINRYIADLAAASGRTDNVESVDTEYFDKVSGAKAFLTYALHSGTPIVLTDPFPSNGCKPASGFSTCLTDEQIRDELRRATSSRKLPTDLGHFYPVFLPAKVETQDRDGTNSLTGFCGYHRAFGSGANQTVYAITAYTSGCENGQAPNGSAVADGAVSTLSHELNEAITDPLEVHRAWNDQAGHEIGDMCSETYGRPLGSTSKSNPGTTEYNQVINGDKYYIQTEFSNLAYDKFGLGKGCTLSEALAQNPDAAGTGTNAATVTGVLVQAAPTALPADGKSTSEIDLGTRDPNGFAVAGDHIHFTAGVLSGDGQCGTLSTTDETTDDNGHAGSTYTASTDNVVCEVTAVDGLGGRSAEVVIYQGTTQADSPVFHASFPKSLQAGGSPTTFTAHTANPSSQPIPVTRINVVIFPGGPKAKAVKADQVHLSYSTTGANGTFTDVPLTGSTGGGNAIQGWVGPSQGSTMAAHSAKTLTFRVGLASSVPASEAGKPVMALEAYLDQINAASGSGATLADTYASDVTVTPSSSTRPWVLIAIGAVVVALAILGLVAWRRRKRRPENPPTEATAP